MDDCSSYRAVIWWWGSSLHNVATASHTHTHTHNPKTTVKRITLTSEFISCAGSRTGRYHLHWYELSSWPLTVRGATRWSHNMAFCQQWAQTCRPPQNSKDNFHCFSGSWDLEKLCQNMFRPATLFLSSLCNLSAAPVFPLSRSRGEEPASWLPLVRSQYRAPLLLKIKVK